MKTLFFIPLVLLSLVSFPNWGRVADGKSIVCHCTDCNYEERGWKFKNDEVISVFGTTVNDEVSIKEEG